MADYVDHCSRCMGVNERMIGLAGGDNKAAASSMV